MTPVTVRAATVDDAVAIARVRVESWRATYRGMIPQAYLDGMTVEASATLWGKILATADARTHTFVAEDAEGVFGFSSGLVLAEPKQGFGSELAAVYLKPTYQRNGIGTRLVAAVAAALAKHGATDMITWVIAGNTAARRFYDALDAELVVEQPFEWDGMDLEEAGYGWRDIAPLAAMSRVASH
ncbi:MAG: GNAT family N-acetyltransferase [Proteobacteria bacterium]|nr:GNAT family N-acetyltransferase [Pseudomonadota bacterium]